MTPLGREIAALIEAEGPITVARHMSLCLGHPLHGYYATRDPFGPRGDFTTSPEISQMFGELIGLWCAEVWRLMGRPSRVALIELGPGRGALMADMLRAARAAPGFLDAAEIVLVETSATLREVQARTLAGTDVRWTATIEEALALDPSPCKGEGGPAIVVSNEFFDALPIRQFVRSPKDWRERLVGLSADGALAFGLAAEAPLDIALPDAPEGSVREVGAEAIVVTTRVAAHLRRHGGAALAIDYGYAAGFGDTLQAVKTHEFADPLAEPGEVDLTAHVDFGALASAAGGNGAAVMRLVSQADFLNRLGLAARAENLCRASPDRRAEIMAAAARLTDRAPTGMGALFKVFAFADPRLGPLPAFETDGAAP